MYKLHQITIIYLIFVIYAICPIITAQTLPDYVFSGEVSGDYFGSSVAIAGDVNNDGYDDIVIGARGNDEGGTDAGKVYIYSGKDSSLIKTFTGNIANGYFGAAVAGAGDVNNDGYDDVIVGAYGQGKAYVFSGNQWDTLFIGSGGGNYGYTVAGIGDIELDGYDDFAIGYPNDGPPSVSGSIYVYSGGESASLKWVKRGTGYPEALGVSLAGIGDINNDNHPDFAGGTQIGRVRIYSGLTGELLFPILDWGGGLFNAIDGIEDVDNDGFNDIILANENYGTYTGSLWILSGQNLAIIYYISGESGEDRFGHSVSSVGDINSDGIPDFLVGAPYQNSLIENAGKAYLFSGIDGTLLSTFLPENAGDQFGCSVNGDGDINNDGLPDLVIGASQNDYTDTNAGRVYGFTPPFEFITPGLKGHWPFEENAGDITYDNSGNGYIGAIYGASWTEGFSGNALFFNGIDIYLQVSASNWLSPGGGAWSVSAWIKTTQDGYIINHANGLDYYRLYVQNGKAIFEFRNGDATAQPATATSVSSIVDGEWHHLVGIKLNTQTADIYVDGVLEGTDDYVGTLTAIDVPQAPIQIGKSSLGDYFSGTIDELEVFNKAITQDEIFDLMAPDHNLEAMAIWAPQGEVLLNTPYIPSVIIKNKGLNSESGYATFSIGRDYSENVTYNIIAGATDTVEFPIWQTSEVAAYYCKCVVELEGDQNPRNNTIDGVIYVVNAVGPEIHSINPGIGLSGQIATLDVIGNGFETNMTSSLMLSGEQDIISDSISFINDTLIEITYDLANATIDQWDLKIENQLNNSYTFYKGFEIVPFDTQLFSLCDEQNFIAHDGSIIETETIVPEVENLFVILKKSNRINYNGSWSADVTLSRFGNEVANQSGAGDVIFHLENPSSGLYDLDINVFDPGKGRISICSTLTSVNFDDWYIGEILSPGGYDWVQLDIPEGQDTLFVQTEGFGMWSTIDVYYESLSNPTQHWLFNNPPNGYHIEGKIISPPAGRYYLRYMDSAVLQGTGDDQKRQYMLYVSTTATPSLPPIEPTLTGLSTYTGGQGPVTVIVSGTGLDSAATVYLARESYDSVVAEYVYGDSTGTELISTFDFSGTETGEWQFIITNPSGQSDTANQAFTIETSVGVEIWVDIMGRNHIRYGRLQSFIFTIQNNGNIDAIGVPLWIAGIPENSQVELDFQFIPPPDSTDTTNWDIVPTHLIYNSEIVFPVLLSKIPAYCDGELTIKILVPVGTNQFELTAWANPAIYGSPINPAVIDCIRSLILAVTDLAPGIDCLLQLYDGLWKVLAEEIYGVRAFNHLQIMYNIMLQCTEFTGPQAELFELIKDIVKLILTIVNIDEVCSDAFPPPIPPSSASISIIPTGSSTPEDKIGPNGFDTAEDPIDSLKRYVKNTKGNYNYRIDFWNHEEATAPAQNVYIEDTLDEDFEITSFGFTDFGFLKWDIPLGGGQYFNIDVDMRPDESLLVNVEGTYDPDNRIVKWTLRSIDPITGEPPEDPMAGFLPPIDSTGYNIGWVDFTIDPLPDLITGTQITNQAFVNFDSLPACDTCPFWSPAPKERPYLNTIDADPPESEVLALPATMDSLYFTVDWAGSDGLGSGIKYYSVYYDVDSSGVYQLWLEDTTATSSEFVFTEDEHTYSFYSIATDNLGFVESPPDSFDTRTTMSFPFVCGDVNCDTTVNIFDITYLITNLYLDGPDPCHPYLADLNGRDGLKNIFDITYLISFLYLEGPSPDCIGSDKTFASVKKTPKSDSALIVCSSKEGKSVIEINSPEEIFGIEMILKSKDARTATLGSLVDGVKLYYSQDGDIITLGMVDAEGRKFIPKGKTEIIEIDGEVEILSILAADKSSQPIPFKFNNIILPREFSLDQNYPNPFNPTTTIKFALPKSSHVELEIFNILGQRVTTLINDQLDAGYYTAKWNSTDSQGREVATGVYFYRLRAGDFVKSKKMLLLK